MADKKPKYTIEGNGVVKRSSQDIWEKNIKPELERRRKNEQRRQS